MSAHTPGPWKAEQRGDDWGIWAEESMPGHWHRVLSIRKGVLPSNTDARLIAAAPLMYEELARLYTEEGSALKPETCTRLLTLLAQVQGESNV